MNAALSPFELRLSNPLETSDGRIDQRMGWIITAGNDVTGYGEATPLPGFTESRADCESALSAAITHLQADAVPAAYAAVTDRPAARHGLATALLDRQGKETGRPLYRLLGADHEVDAIAVNATIGHADPQSTADAASSAVEDGFRTLKIKVGTGSLDRDVDRIAAVRDAVGEEVSLRVDANGAWDRETAAEAIDRFLADDVALIEQPLPAGDLAGHRSLRGRLPIALDESLTAHDPQAVLAADAADALVLKPMALGGPDVARAVAHRARRAGVAPIVSNTIDGAIARTAAVHVAASIPDRPAAGLATGSLLATDVAPDPAPVVDGRIAVPQTPGLGISEVQVDA
ncbi:o-succinylbenzoate synthase [Halanaeroarchaeum sulfurireducens]|uniref:o-succinylbenzoate synthase n=1 Tax=Halanaeroarchaeum sulfurireducens TaxID=1604004 RepID=A0A0F7PAN2_9EURY|nr:o-succinylbenzoate synthase [Halanaeroarchaeum sulfurireducens]AKH97797.1 O-succinylbenzoate synthase [Halanaeroarchaeum sulfurireducens]ALG82191.1 O-succinylbenzoate synthase [Halanaeroarchaeum sulfurireducens]